MRVDRALEVGLEVVELLGDLRVSPADVHQRGHRLREVGRTVRGIFIKGSLGKTRFETLSTIASPIWNRMLRSWDRTRRYANHSTYL